MASPADKLADLAAYCVTLTNLLAQRKEDVASGYEADFLKFLRTLAPVSRIRFGEVTPTQYSGTGVAVCKNAKDRGKLLNILTTTGAGYNSVRIRGRATTTDELTEHGVLGIASLRGDRCDELYPCTLR
eukprot:NODE_3041_length_462_cov_7.161194_g2991_i0.p2 GENE.NODE_3041_length_462_cov_7.161194_g2991_i0~~NODE_3041_length_462_cov_7.161194_g2991_i0.p2  ORF type:complete len:129 (+),score=2.10 NODE_3041_length_462_cov_7.161194_g2991_i0:74-460(+)